MRIIFLLMPWYDLIERAKIIYKNSPWSHILNEIENKPPIFRYIGLFVLLSHGTLNYVGVSLLIIIPT